MPSAKMVALTAMLIPMDKAEAEGERQIALELPVPWRKS
jgi:hypothetical protein